ncbi:MAG: hypothetical protein ABGX25_06070 [Nautiliaceae bacterium]
MNLPLRDIKPNAVLIDWQWYLFLSFAFLIIVLLLVIGYKLYKNKKRENHKKTILKKLQNLPFEDAKKTAYEFTALGRIFVNEENEKLFEEIEKELEKYKYKPLVPPLDENTKEKIEEFIRTIK